MAIARFEPLFRAIFFYAATSPPHARIRSRDFLEENLGVISLTLPGSRARFFFNGARFFHSVPRDSNGFVTIRTLVGTDRREKLARDTRRCATGMTSPSARCAKRQVG